MLTTAGQDEDAYADATRVQVAEAEMLRLNNSRLHALIHTMRGQQQPASKDQLFMREEAERQSEEIKKVRFAETAT